MGTKINFFSNCHTIEEIKKRYRKLAQKFHPDHGGGDGETMKQINLQYEKFKNVKFKGYNHETKKEYSTTFDPFDGYREIIDKLINLEGITIELCGTWLWVGGNTKPNKEYLSEIGLKYSSKKIMWYWHPGSFRKKSKKNMTIDEIRNKYGSETVNRTEKEQKQAIA